MPKVISWTSELCLLPRLMWRTPSSTSILASEMIFSRPSILTAKLSPGTMFTVALPSTRRSLNGATLHFFLHHLALFLRFLRILHEVRTVAQTAATSNNFVVKEYICFIVFTLFKCPIIYFSITVFHTSALSNLPNIAALNSNSRLMGVSGLPLLRRAMTALPCNGRLGIKHAVVHLVGIAVRELIFLGDFLGR